MIKNFIHSTVFKIAALMFLISFLSVVSMFSSVFISDGAQTDAEAINVAGTLRMQSFRMASMVPTIKNSEEGRRELVSLMKQFENDLHSGVLVNKQALLASQETSQLLSTVTQAWETSVKPQLIEASMQENYNQIRLNLVISNFVDDINKLVLSYQNHAEGNIATIRVIQSVALFGTLILIAFAMLIVNRHIEKPLTRLTTVATQIGRGDFTARADESGDGELALLARTLNKMSDSIYRSQTQLEAQVRRKTNKLSKSNQSLDLLYTISRKLNNVDPLSVDFKPLLKQLAVVTNIPDLDLCFMTAQGASPYEHLISTEKDIPDKCKQQDCGDCTDHNLIFPNTRNKMRYQLTHGESNYGVLSVTTKKDAQLEEWQHQLFEAVAEQIATGLSMKHQLEQGRRMALMNERTVIARELHDSLAQALSYLKIQVTRLQKLQKMEDSQEQIESVIDELKTGLSAAYSELRELLTTFRLKLDGHGIKAALVQTIEQLKTRSEDFQFNLLYTVDNVPFTPQEEIHLLQIAREATQNAFYHSKGNEITISIQNNDMSEVSLSVIDNGIGIPGDPNKLNHYGLAIMRERSRSLNGFLDISKNINGGTIVNFTFLPEYVKQMATKTQQA